MADSTATDPFISSLQSSLLKSSSMVSSDNSKIEDTVNSAIQGVKSSGASSNTAINLDYKGQEQQVKDAGLQKLTSTEEATRGYAVNTGLIQNIQKTTNDQLNALDLKRQEAIAAGDATTASNIANLQMQGLQFQQQATQQVFTNLVSAAGVMINAKNSQQAQEQISFTEKNAISDVALKYGLTVKPGDTIDSITSRAAPFASQAQKLQLDQMRSQIAANNASTQKSIADAAANLPISAADIASIAQAYLTTGSAVLGTIKNTTTLASVINKASDIQYGQYKDVAVKDKSAGLTKSQAQTAIASNSNMTATEQSAALKAVEEVYGTEPAKKSNSGAAFGNFEDFATSLGNAIFSPAAKPGAVRR